MKQVGQLLNVNITVIKIIIITSDFSPINSVEDKHAGNWFQLAYLAGTTPLSCCALVPLSRGKLEATQQQVWVGGATCARLSYSRLTVFRPPCKPIAMR